MNTRFVAAFAAVLFALTGFGALARAQTAPAPTPSALPTIPPTTGGIVQQAVDALGNLIRPAYGWDDNRAQGVVTFYKGYDMQVRLQLDKYRDVHLHRGTVINPRGWTIQSGQSVSVRGHGNSDGSLTADVITVRT